MLISQSLNYLNPIQRELIKQSFQLLAWARKQKNKFYDYSFIVMPAAKAYEGFLKQFIYMIGLISKQQLELDHFRIGKALNPNLEYNQSLQDECFFNEIAGKCGLETAQLLWQTWKECRNRLFHYFANEQLTFSLEEAEQKINQIMVAIDVIVQRNYCNTKKD